LVGFNLQVHSLLNVVHLHNLLSMMHLHFLAIIILSNIVNILLVFFTPSDHLLGFLETRNVDTFLDRQHFVDYGLPQSKSERLLVHD
jgi:hypothetical protein